jgi:hypothetical protein
VTPEDLFGLVSAAALPGWAILILAPRRWPLLNAVPALLLPGALSALYAGVVLTHFADAAAAGGGFGSLDHVARLFADDWALLAGWVHYLAFDLFVGAWAAARMDRNGLDRMMQAALLICIFLFGPLGLALVLLTELGLRGLLMLPRPHHEKA